MYSFTKLFGSLSLIWIAFAPLAATLVLGPQASAPSGAYEKVSDFANNVLLGIIVLFFLAFWAESSAEKRQIDE